MWKTPVWLHKVSEGTIISLGDKIHGEIEESLRRDYMYNSGWMLWVDGGVYPVKKDKSLFGRVGESFPNWGELRKQKKAPHVEVLYVYCLQGSVSRVGESFASEETVNQSLVLRSINNCSNSQLQDAIKLAALRLEQGSITQTQAENLLDRCYAEIQRRLAWTDSEKAERNAKPQKYQNPQNVVNPGPNLDSPR